MALPGSGAIALSDIQTEFGGSNPISISEYYAADTGVPASGAISFSDFYGTSAEGVEFNLSVTTISSNRTTPTSAYIELNSNGTADQIKAGTTTSIGTWYSAAPSTGIGADYEVRVTATGDTVVGSATGSWLALSSDRAWGVATVDEDVLYSASLTIEIRDTATSTVQDTIAVTLQARHTSGA